MTTPVYGPRKVRRRYAAGDITALAELARRRRTAMATAATDALGHVDDERATRALLDALGDSRERVRYHALTALRRQLAGGSPPSDPTRSQVLDALAATLRSDASDWVRVEAIRTLGAAPDRRAVAPLLEALGPTKLGREAALALCHASDPVIATRGFNPGEDARERRRGLHLRDPEVYWALFDFALSGEWHLHSGNSDQHHWVRRWLTEAVSQSVVSGILREAGGDDEARRALALSVIESGRWDNRSRQLLAEGMPALAGPAKAAAIKNITERDHSYVPLGIEDSLIEALNDPAAEVRAAAIEGLSSRKKVDKETRDAVLAALSDPDAKVRSEAAYFFSQHPSKKATPWLIAELASTYRSWGVIRALRAIGDPRAIPALKTLASRPAADNYARTEAIAALVEMRAEDLAPFLEHLLSDSDASVRERAAEGLRKLGRAESAKPGSYGPAAWHHGTLIAFGASALVAIPIWRWGVTPLTDDGWFGNRWASLWMLTALYGAVYVAWRNLRSDRRWERLGRWGQRAVALLAIPAVLSVVAWFMAPIHADYEEAVRVFERYTHRFPDGSLHNLIVEDESSYVMVCARQGDGFKHMFCAGVDPDRSDGDQVIGGFKASANNDWYPTECYGARKVCRDGQPEVYYE